MALAVALGAFPAARGLAGDAASPSADSRDARQAELDAVTRDIALTDERLAELKAEIDKLDKDRAVAQRRPRRDGQAGRRRSRCRSATPNGAMQALSGEEEAVRSSLVARRDVLAEVLAALQRMGRRPPPAILVRPEDALASVRSAILLGAVVPDLRAAADKLAADLKQLVALKAEIAGERQRLLCRCDRLAEERARIQMLLDERRNQREASTAALADEEKKTAELADQASGLKELISGMEQEIASAAAAKAAADRATEAAQAKPSPAKPASLGRAGPADAGPRLRRRQGTAAEAGRRPAGQGFRRTRRNRRQNPRDFDRHPRRRPGHLRRPTAGWSMPGPSAATANS